LRRDAGPFSFPEVKYLLSQICNGVQAIHDSAVIHRDLKPENVLLTYIPRKGWRDLR
jgi:serine/threonine protein kinase